MVKAIVFCLYKVWLGWNCWNKTLCIGKARNHLAHFPPTKPNDQVHATKPYVRIMERKRRDPSILGRISSKRSRTGTQVAVLTRPQRRMYIPRSLQPELKRHNFPAFASQQTLNHAASAFTYAFCSQIGQGVTGGTRVGDQIFAKRLTVRGNISQNATAVFERAVVCFILDSQPAAGVPGFTDVFQGGLPLDTDYFNPILNDDKRRRFKILKMLRWPLMWQAAVQAVGGGSILASPQSHAWECSMPINRKISYNESAGAPYMGGEIYMFAWSDSTSNLPFLDASGFLSYTDV